MGFAGGWVRAPSTGSEFWSWRRSEPGTREMPRQQESTQQRHQPFASTSRPRSSAALKRHRTVFVPAPERIRWPKIGWYGMADTTLRLLVGIGLPRKERSCGAPRFVLVQLILAAAAAFQTYTMIGMIQCHK